MRLSIVVATYNRAGWLVRLLDSVVGQTAQNQLWEIVVVDNNCIDDTRARFEQWQANHPQINARMVVETNQGLSYAMNRGIVESQGELIALIDDDQTVNDRFVEAYICFFDTHADVPACGGRIIPQYETQKPKWLSKYTELPIAFPLDLGDVQRAFPRNRYPGGGNMAIRRVAIDALGGFNTSLGRTGGELVGGEERDFFYRLRQQGGELWYVPDAIIWHHIPDSRLTDEYFERVTYGVGVSQRRSAKRHGGYFEAVVMEGVKWISTLVLAVGYTVRGTPQKARYLIKMRWQISKGLLGQK